MDAQDRARDFASALIFVAFGAVAVALALGWPLGTLRRIGPGALPVLAGLLLVAAGIGLGVQAWARGRDAGPLVVLPSMPEAHVVRAVLFITGSLVVFALLIRPAGLFLATAALALIGRQAEPGGTIVGSLALAAAIATVACLIFVAGIGLPFRVWP